MEKKSSQVQFIEKVNLHGITVKFLNCTILQGGGIKQSASIPFSDGDRE